MSENKNQPKKKRNPLEPKKKSNFSFYWIYAIIAVVLIGINLMGDRNGTKTINEFPELQNIVDSGFVKYIAIQDGRVAQVTLTEEAYEDKKNEFKTGGLFGGVSPKGPHYTCVLSGTEDSVNELRAASQREGFKIENKVTDESLNQLFTWLIFIGIFVAIWVIMMRRLGGGGPGGGQIFNIGKSKAQLFEKGKGTDVNFNDVAGLEGAKEEVQEIVDFLKHPKKYTELGAKIPKGALLVGPPGTGKTLLAKAVAGEAQVPFFSLSGSDFVEMFVGVGASRVRDLFKQAKEKAPAIIFIDEIDAIGRARGKNAGFGSNDERENTLNQLLTEMDGFGTNSGVIILAATNRADVLDSALMRAGRFDRQIYVDMPDLNERKEIFEVHLKPIKVSTDINVDFLARQTPGFSGADIANICNEAALIAARKSKQQVTRQDFLDAVDRIIGGLEKKNKIITPEEKEAIAFHEAGHATVSWLLKYASPLVKVTIVPRGQSLGAAWYLPEERSITTTEQMLDEMCATLGGRAAEEVIFGKISTGALSDLEKVTKQAYAMVTVYGLNEKLGNISYYDSRGENQFTKPYSEDTAKTIDEEVKKMIDISYQRAIDLLKTNKDKLTKLAKKLLEKEVIFKDDLEEIIGARPEGARSSESINEMPPVVKPVSAESEPKDSLDTNTETEGGEPEPAE
ncbi:MAG: ATP-dependent zinc metalloprotease FtsH [Flavobacteriales bacterium]